MARVSVFNKQSFMKHFKSFIISAAIVCFIGVYHVSYGQGPGNANAGSPGNANVGGAAAAGNAGGAVAAGNANAAAAGNAGGAAAAAGAAGGAAAGGGPVNIPVDGGLTIFLGLGAAYGIKRMYDVVKNKNAKTE